MARPPPPAYDMLHVNSFDVRYREDGAVEQFVSDLSVFDREGHERLRKAISVNDPLRYQVGVITPLSRCMQGLLHAGSLNPRRQLWCGHAMHWFAMSAHCGWMLLPCRVPGAKAIASAYSMCLVRPA